MVVDTTLYNSPDGESAGRIFTGRTGRYIMLSTGQVYLVRAGLDRPFAERDYAGPVVPAPANSKFDLDNWSYGVHKRAAEDALTAAPVPVTILRLREFQPDLIHITGPGDVSILGLWAASLVGAPAMAAWHTNIHEYAYRRLQAALSFLPRPIRERVSTGAGNGTLRAAMRFYRIAHFVAAANQEMVDLLGRETGRPSFLMAHGVDTGLFVPARRRRTDSHFQIGYVGRLTPEKNVRALVELERNLLAAGERDFRIVLVGEGGERDWLGANLRHARFAGVLHGEDLANTFANLDALVFPSLTDTFGLVMLEAMSSGVPVIVNPETPEKKGE